MMKITLRTLLTASFLALVVFAPAVGMLGGIWAGWLLGWLFTETWLSFQAWFHIPLDAWQVGLIAGFFGGFFRSIHSDRE